MRTPHGRLVFCVALFATIAVMALARLTAGRTAALAGTGRFTINEIADRSTALYRSVTPYNGAVHIMADRQRMFGSFGAPRDIWTVDGSDAGGRHLFRAQWDARTGELQQLNRSITVAPPDHVDLDRREGMRAAWEWLQTVGMVDHSEHWRLDGEPEAGPYKWCVAWRSEDRRAYAEVSRRSGDLIAARVYPVPPGEKALSSAPIHHPKQQPERLPAIAVSAN